MNKKDNETIQMLKEQIILLKSKTKTQTITLVTSAFGFVTALFWRDAIQSFLKQTFNITAGEEGFWLIQTITAVFITIFSVVVIFFVSKFSKDKELNKK